MTDIVTLLCARAVTNPDDPALRYGRSHSLTYRQLVRRIVCVAGNLTDSGFESGDRMLFSIRPSPDAVVLILATMAAGGTIVFVDPGMGEDLFGSRVRAAVPRWAAAESLLYSVSAPGVVRRVAHRRGLVLPNLGAVPVRHIRSGSWLPGVPRGAMTLRSLMRSRVAEQPWRQCSRPESEALIVFTSGTTSTPKAVVHTHASLVAAFSALATRCHIGCGATLHTDQAMIGLGALLAGALWSIPRNGRTSAAPLRFMRDLRSATHTFVVPSDLPRLLRIHESGARSIPTSLQHVLLGGAPVNAHLLRDAVRTLPDVEFLAIYGMTEILPVAIVSAAEKLSFRGSGDLAGAPLPSVRARIEVDGELMLSGPNRCAGYLGEPPLDEVASGDIARIENNRIVLLGRKKDMIIRGKTNIYPSLYEAQVVALPGVEQCAMVGVPDKYGREQIGLVLVTEGASPHHIVRRVSAALPGLIDHDVQPDVVFAVPELPVSGRGRKLDRPALARLVAVQLGKENA